MDFKKLSKSFKKNLRDKLNDLQDFVTDNDEVAQAASVASSVIDAVAQVHAARLGGPVAVVGALAHGAKTLFENGNADGYNQRFRRWAENHNLVWAPENVRKTLIMLAPQYGAGAFERYDIFDQKSEDSAVFVRRRDDKDGMPIIAYLSLKHDGKERVEDDLVFVNKDAETVDSILRSLVGKHVTIRGSDKESGTVTLTELEYSIPPGHLFDQKTVNELKAKINTYKEHDVSFAAFIVGPPGNGKSSFCLALAIDLNASLLTVYPEAIREFRGDNQLTDLIAAIRSDIVVFEDIDRIGHDFGSDSKLLGMLDILRKRSPKTIILSTANNKNALSAALRRPGRLGPEFRLEAPNLEKRTKILLDYAKMFGVQRDISKLAEHMTHANFTYDYIRDVARQALVEDDAYLVRYIKGLTREFSREDGDGFTEDTDASDSEDPHVPNAVDTEDEEDEYEAVLETGTGDNPPRREEARKETAKQVSDDVAFASWVKGCETHDYTENFVKEFEWIAREMATCNDAARKIAEIQHELLAQERRRKQFSSQKWYGLEGILAVQFRNIGKERETYMTRLAALRRHHELLTRLVASKKNYLSSGDPSAHVQLYDAELKLTEELKQYRKPYYAYRFKNR